MDKQPIASIKTKKLSQYLFSRLNMRFKTSKNNSKENLLTKVTMNGAEISLNLADIDQLYLFNEHIREPENIIVYKAIAADGLCDTFVDIGANYGHDALLISRDFEQVVLIEPNPNAVDVLQKLFKNDTNVKIVSGAIVNKESPKDLILKVPKSSSALASLGTTHLLRDDYEEVSCKGYTIDECVNIFENKAYVKIDVEGAEYEILSDIAADVVNSRTVVGFEALSREYAVKCSKLFADYTFFYSRFDFLNADGSLFSSALPIAGALMGVKNSISIYEVNSQDFNEDPDNYSQVYCVPNEKKDVFVNAVKSYCQKINEINLVEFS